MVLDGDFLGFFDGMLNFLLNDVGLAFGFVHVLRLHGQDFAHFVRRLGSFLHRPDFRASP